MTPTAVIELGRQAVEVTLMVSAPLFLAALVTGLIISIFQAATQINEQTMTFIPKIVAVFVTLIIFAPWMIRVMVNFTAQIFRGIATVGG